MGEGGHGLAIILLNQYLYDAMQEGIEVELFEDFDLAEVNSYAALEEEVAVFFYAGEVLFLVVIAHHLLDEEVGEAAADCCQGFGLHLED